MSAVALALASVVLFAQTCSYKTAPGTAAQTAVMKAQATFIIDTWNETVLLDEPDAQCKLVRTAITKTFSGDIVGKSVAETIMAGAGAANESAAYCGFERFAVTIAGQTGTFVLHHDAAMSKGGGGHARWNIMASSGTAGFAGIQGTATITRHDDGSHSFALDYELG
jgi:hypothetical protein